MEFENAVARRTVLRAGAGAAVIATVVPLLETAAVAAPGQPGARTVERSDNGWDVENGVDAGGQVWQREVQGTGLRVPLRIGLAQVVLHHVIRRYHYNVETLRPGDVVGFL